MEARRYSYVDYENAYYSGDWAACKKIGCKLLAEMQDAKSLELLCVLKRIRSYKRIPKFGNTDVLTELRSWLMANIDDR